MLVIIPGWMHAAKEWSAVSDLLKQQNVEHTIVDLPGFGTVPPDTSLITLQDLTTWCAIEIAKIQRQSTTPLTLVGHSCGGRIGLQLVAEGLVVEQLVLIGSPNLYRPTVLVRLIKLLVSVFRPIQSRVPYTIRSRLRSKDYSIAKNTAMHALYVDVIKDDQTGLLAKVTDNVQLLWGEYDTAAPLTTAQEMVTKLSSAQLTILPRLGHNLHYENPQLLAAKLKNYVTNA